MILMYAADEWLMKEWPRLRWLIIIAAFALIQCKSANSQADGDHLLPDQYCSYVDAAIPNRLQLLTGDDYRPKTLVSRITGFSGLADKFQVRYADVPNASAAIMGEQRYILLNPNFMEQMKVEAGTNWATVAVLAHEIGHHLSGHTLDRLGSRPDKELEADQYSGYVLNLMGATLKEAQSAMRVLADPTAVTTHPKRIDRLKAIENGWRLAGQNKQPASKGLNHATVLTPDEKAEHERKLAEEQERAALEAARLRDEEDKKALYEMLTPIVEFRDAMWSTQPAGDGTTNLAVQFTLEIRNAQSEEGQVVLLFENTERKLIKDKNGLWTTQNGYAAAASRYFLKSKDARFPHAVILFPLNEIDVPAGQHTVFPILRYYEKRDNGVSMRIKQVRLPGLGIKVTKQ